MIWAHLNLQCIKEELTNCMEGKIPQGLLNIKSPTLAQKGLKPTSRALRALIDLNERNQPHLGALPHPLQCINPGALLKLSLWP